MNSLEAIRDEIKNADMILLGIGEELRVSEKDVLAENPVYTAFGKEIESLEKPECDFIKNSLYTYELENGHNLILTEKIKVYNRLKELIGDKNYFAVTTCKDDVICFSDFDGSRVVRPCGTKKLMKCQNGCCKEVQKTEEAFANLNEKLLRMYREGSFSRGEIERSIPRCRECGTDMEINAAGTSGYSEKGYEKDWKHYTMWLQGTLNRRICILELGVGFAFPTVIRWPFERIAALNNKACFVRVNEKLPQIAKEIKDKSFSVKMNSGNFIAEIAV